MWATMELPDTLVSCCFCQGSLREESEVRVPSTLPGKDCTICTYSSQKSHHLHETDAIQIWGHCCSLLPSSGAWHGLSPAPYNFPDALNLTFGNKMPQSPYSECIFCSWFESWLSFSPRQFQCVFQNSTQGLPPASPEHPGFWFHGIAYTVVLMFNFYDFFTGVVDISTLFCSSSM